VGGVGGPAPAEPVDVPLEVPEAADRRFVTGWLRPERSAGPAGPLADALLDAAHVPFVHAAASRAAVGSEVPAWEVIEQPGGFDSVPEQWSDVPRDPAVTGGGRPPRRTTWTYRAPFQLRLRRDHLDTGAVTTTLFLLQPEDVDSTRVHSCVLLSAGPGRPLPTPAAVAERVAVEERVLAADLALQAQMASAGLPLAVRDELHVRTDRLGVALRGALAGFDLATRRRAAA
jgi:hypothetical protein